MKKYLSMVKRWDIIIILSLCILSFLSIAIFSYVKANEPAPANGKKELVAVISVDNKEYKTVTLT
ncbi:flavin-based extracellular electron transfer system protein EetA, partial [Escherichia coli]|nr:flavin-based extracellular electron transfer system protein EetA [Escherichia coli]